MRTLQSFKVVLTPDTDPLLDYLGEFSNSPSKFSIDHWKKVGESRNTFRFFNASNVENQKQAEQNYNEIMKIEKGELSPCGVSVKATIKFSYNNYSFCQEIETPALYGFFEEDKDSIQEVEKEKFDELQDMLLDLGFTKKEIDDCPFEK